MLILHMSDLHYCDKHLEGVDRCTRYAIEYGIKEGCNLAVISGDLFDSSMEWHSAAAIAALDAVRTLADKMPVVILQGTFSHDHIGSLEPFKRLKCNYEILVADKIGQWILQNNGLFCEPTPGYGNSMAALVISSFPPVHKGNIAAALGNVDNIDNIAGELVHKAMQAFAPLNNEYREKDVPSILVSHGTVNGCMTEHMVPMHGTDHEFTMATLAGSGADCAMLGHIHKEQSWFHESVNGVHFIAGYPGSIEMLHYGEKPPKGFYIWDVSVGNVVHRRVETPYTRKIDINFEGEPDLVEIKEIVCANPEAKIRVNYEYREERKDQDFAKMVREALGDVDGKINGRMIPIQRTRAAGITQTVTVQDKLKAWCEVTENDYAELEPLLEEILT